MDGVEDYCMVEENHEELREARLISPCLTQFCEFPWQRCCCLVLAGWYVEPALGPLRHSSETNSSEIISPLLDSVLFSLPLFHPSLRALALCSLLSLAVLAGFPPLGEVKTAQKA